MKRDTLSENLADFAIDLGRWGQNESASQINRAGLAGAHNSQYFHNN